MRIEYNKKEIDRHWNYYRYYRKFYKGAYVIVRVDLAVGDAVVNWYTRYGVVEKTFINGLLYNYRPHYVRGRKRAQEYIERLEEKGQIPNLYRAWWNHELTKVLGEKPEKRTSVALFGGYAG